MSKTIDEKVVQMRFDNKDFESNVQTSLGTIGKLKQALNFKDSSKSLENVSAAAKNVNMSPLASAVETVQTKFSALQVMAVTALANITNSAINAGKRIVSALTIDPIKSGFQEYETQINAVQTILANTQSKGTTLDQVNNALDELNTYADKTIYNFTEMTRNIGTFTAAGVDLDTSVSAIKGIANLAAISGSSSQQASTAMYQLSQALATGKVTLQDWNSVVNAGMGGELFQNALKRTAENLGTNVDAMIEKYGSFRESLTEGGWLTTEVLTETLKQISGAYTEADLIAQGFTESQAKEIMELAKTGEDAATKVKTFTQLWDTLKEAAQSGWTQSWELIIGDFEEAKEMLTGVSDTLGEYINASAEARNKVLSDWKELGGRTAIIESIKNTFQGLLSIIQPIKEAFRDIFPAITGEQLANFSKGLQSLTEKFKVSNETADKIKRTFKGLFSIIDIGKQLFLALAEALSPVGGFLLNIADAILSVTAVVGDYITAFDEMIKQTDLFGTIFEALGKIVEPVGNFIKGIIDKIKDAFDSLGTFEIGDLGGLTDKLKNAVTPFEKIGEMLKWAFENLSKVLSNVGTYIGKAFSFLKTALTEGLDSPVFDRVLGFLNGGIVTSILFGLKGIIDNLKNMASGGGILSGITDILDGVKDCLKAYQTQLKAGTLIKIASAIAILAGSLLLVSMIDSDKLIGSLAAIGTMMLELMGSMVIFEKVAGDKNFKKLSKISTNMILMSTAILILSSAMKNLSELDWNGIAKGLTGVAGLCAVLVASSSVMSQNSGKMISTSLGLVIFAGALSILVGVVKSLGGLDTDQLMQGLIGVAAICTEISAFLALTDLDGMGITKGIGLVALASSILILSKAVESFSSLDIGSLTKGLSAVGVVLLEIAAFVKLTGDSSKVVSTAVGLTILAAAMLIYAEAVERMGNLSIEQIGKGLLTMAGALLVIAGALRLMPTNILGTSVGMVILASGLLILSDALKSMGSMSWDELGKGLGVLIISLAALAAAVNLMNGCLAGAAAILIVAAALAVLAPVLVTLGSMTWSEIGKGLLTLAGAFTVIGVAGLLLSPIVPVIALLGAAIALLGVGCLAAGAGVLAFATGLGALAAIGVGGLAGLIAVLEALIDLIPEFFKKVGEGIVEAIKAIGESAAEIADAVLTLISALLQSLNEHLPTIVETFANLILTLLNTIAEYLPQFIDAGMKIVLGFLQGVTQYIPQLVQAGTDLIVALLNGIANNIEPVVNAAYNIVISFINALTIKIPELITAGTNLILAIIQGIGNAMTQIADAATNVATTFINGISSRMQEIITAGTNLITSFIQGIGTGMVQIADAAANIIITFINTLNENAQQIISAGTNLIISFIQGVGSSMSTIVDTAVNVVVSFLNGVGEKLPEVVDAGFNLIINFINGLADSIDQNTPILVDAIDRLVDSMINAAIQVFTASIPSFSNAGSNVIGNGFIQGVRSKISSAVSTVKEIPTKAVSAIKSFVSQFTSAGGQLISGLVNGIKSKASSAVSAVKNIPSQCVSAIKSYASQFVSAGAQLINGLVQGVQSKVSSAVSAIKSAASNIVSAAKSAFGINSPSRVFAEMGMYNMEGLANGITKYGRLAVNATKKISDDTIDAMSNSLSNLVIDNIDTQPTIRPVFDMSSVEEGASAINDLFASRRTVSLGLNQNENIGSITSAINRNKTATNDDVVSAINDLKRVIGATSGDSYNINGISYDDGSNITDAVRTIVRAARIERRR